MNRIEQIKYELKIWREVQELVRQCVKGSVMFAELAQRTRENELATIIHDRIAILQIELRNLERQRLKAFRDEREKAKQTGEGAYSGPAQVGS